MMNDENLAKLKAIKETLEATKKKSVDDVLKLIRQKSSKLKKDAHEEKLDELRDKWTTVADVDASDGKESLPSHLLLERRLRKRKFRAGKRKEELSLLVPELPDIDTDYYIVASGRGKVAAAGDIVQSFGFGNFIDYVSGKFGDGCVVYLSTWSMNEDHVFLLLELLSSGKLSELHVLCDPAFTMRKNGIMMTLKHGLGRFSGSEYKTFKNHCKITCISDSKGERFCTITGSANLSGTPRAENYTLSTSPEMYHHFVDKFFKVIFDD